MKLRPVALCPVLVLALAPAAASASTSAHARGGSHVADGKATATRATVMARRDALAKVAGELRAFAAMAAPPNMSAKEQKAYATFTAKVVEAADKCDELNAGLDAALKKGSGFDEALESFTLQTLQLQTQMQNEAKTFTAVSNVMKTRHDTIKNSISNIR